MSPNRSQKRQSLLSPIDKNSLNSKADDLSMIFPQANGDGEKKPKYIATIE